LRSIFPDFFKAGPKKRLRLGDFVGLGCLGWRDWQDVGLGLQEIGLGFRGWRDVGLGLLMKRRRVRIQLCRELF
jgi:hypothetical protein